MAADLVQDEGRPGAEAMRAAVLEWRAAEASAADAVRARLFQQLWSVLGGTAALWGIGVLLLAPRKAPAPLAPSSPALVVEPAADAPLSLSVREMPVPEPPVAAPTPYLPLDPAAALCTDIARADTAAALDALVDRAASMLGAAGIVIWLKGPQDELVPAVVHGYGPEAHARIGSLPLSDANLTTRAWHAGVLQSAAGDGRATSGPGRPAVSGRATHRRVRCGTGQRFRIERRDSRAHGHPGGAVRGCGDSEDRDRRGGRSAPRSHRHRKQRSYALISIVRWRGPAAGSPASSPSASAPSCRA